MDGGGDDKGRARPHVSFEVWRYCYHFPFKDGSYRGTGECSQSYLANMVGNHWPDSGSLGHETGTDGTGVFL